VVTAGVGRISGLSDNLRLVIVRVVKYLVLLLGIGIALTFLGAQLQPLITVMLIVLAVLALTMRGIADNFGAGIVLQTRKPIGPGDEISSQGYTGVVLELNGRSVVIRTNDGRVVHLPNAELLSAPLTNHSEHGVRRSEVEVRLTDPDLSVSHGLPATTQAVPGVLTDPAADIVLVTVEPSRVVLRLRFWHEPLAYVRVTSAVVEQVGAHLRTGGVDATVTSLQPDPPNTPPAPI
jgi:small-conductance mechanosensitive channel